MTTELSGEDASVMAATQKILSLGPAAWGEDAPAPKPRENRPDRDPIEKETSTDLAESEQEQAQERAEAKPDEKAPDEAAADFIEIPGDEGQEAEKVPLADAVEAIKQMRALQGDIASAVNKAEAEYQEKVDRGLSEMIGIYQNMRQHAEAVLMSLPLPQPPDRSLIRTDNEVYELLLNDYEQRVALYQNAQHRYSEAKAEEDRIQSAKDALREKREDERLARYLPEWKNEKTRVELQQSMTDFMVKAYGLEPDVLDKVKFDHRLVRAMHELMTLKSQATKAPDVRKEVQEKAPKITKAAPSQQRAPDGRFASDAAKQLKESGSEEAAARLFLSDPRFKSLFA
jgi:hypothetical protein